PRTATVYSGADLVRQSRRHLRFTVVRSSQGRVGAPSGARNPVGDLRRHGTLWRGFTAWFRQRPVQLQGTLVPALEERLAAPGGRGGRSTGCPEPNARSQSSGCPTTSPPN